MSDYTPTTTEVREDFAYPWEGFQQDREGRLAAFDAWIAQHDAEIQARGLIEAAEWFEAQGFERDLTAALALRSRAERIREGGAA